MVPLEVLKPKVKEDGPVLLLHLLSERGYTNLLFSVFNKGVKS